MRQCPPGPPERGEGVRLPAEAVLPEVSSLRGPLSETELLRFQRRDILFGRRLASPAGGLITDTPTTPDEGLGQRLSLRLDTDVWKNERAEN